MRNYLMGLAMVTCLATGCLGWGFSAKKTDGDDNSVKKTQIAGVLADTKVEAKTDVKANVKADVKATGADLSKKTSIGGNQEIINEGVDMKTLAYIIGAFMALLTTIVTAVLADQKILIGRMIKRAEKKDVQFLDISNDSKEILLKILPMVEQTIHRAYENALKAIKDIKENK